MQVITQDLECSFESKNVQLQILYTKICTNGQGISIVKVHYRITILNGYILLLSGSQCGHYDFVFFFSFETNQKKVQGRSKMGLLCWFLG